MNNNFISDHTDDKANAVVKIGVVEGDTKNITVNAEGNPPQVKQDKNKLHSSLQRSRTKCISS